MFSRLSHKSHSVFFVSMVLMLLSGLSACDNKPPELMKAVKQFESDEIRDQHVAHMRTNHMDALLHKRDETMYKGIRTELHSLKACINCHVPEQHNGKVLRHTDPEHFCSSCHGYVAAQLDCFECHVDHPVSGNQSAAKKVNPHVGELKSPGNKVDNNTADNTVDNTESADVKTLDEATLAENKVASQVAIGDAASE